MIWSTPTRSSPAVSLASTPPAEADSTTSRPQHPSTSPLHSPQQSRPPSQHHSQPLQQPRYFPCQGPHLTAAVHHQHQVASASVAPHPTVRAAFLLLPQPRKVQKQCL